MSDSPNLPIETPDDALMRMLGGATFGKNTKVTLPSGKTVNGDEVQAFSAAFADAACEIRERPRKRSSNIHRPSVDHNNPLSSANDRWTGDQMTDLAALVGRANEAVRQSTRRHRPWWKFWG